MVDLDEKRNLMRIFAGYRPQNAISGSDRVATAFDGQLHDVLGVKVIRIFGKACSSRMLDTLVHRQDREVASAAQAAMADDALQIPQHTRIAVGHRVEPVHYVAARKV